MSWYHRLRYRIWARRQAWLGFWSPETLRWAEENRVGDLHKHQED